VGRASYHDNGYALVESDRYPHNKWIIELRSNSIDEFEGDQNNEVAVSWEPWLWVWGLNHDTPSFQIQLSDPNFFDKAIQYVKECK